MAAPKTAAVTARRERAMRGEHCRHMLMAPLLTRLVDSTQARRGHLRFATGITINFSADAAFLKYQAVPARAASEGTERLRCSRDRQPNQRRPHAPDAAVHMSP